MWNGITPPYTIHVGQKIKLYPPKQREKSAPLVSAKPFRSAKTSPKPAQYRPPEKKIEKKLKVIWQWPLTGVIAKKFSQSGRKGIDIVAKAGAVVRAAADGKVVYSGAGLVGYGNLLIIKHSEVLLSAYAKNRRLLVREGQNVRKGQVIAEIGVISGQDPVLHFEIRKNGKPVDPMLYLSKP